MTTRGPRGAYRKEDRIALPPELQKELVEKAAAKYGNCQELAKHLNIPKSSVHYYRIGRLTMPISILNQLLEIAGDKTLGERIADRGVTKDRTWANEQAISVFREMCRDKLRLPTRDELEKDDGLRRKAAAIISYVLAEGSVWLQKEKWGECAVNITLAAHETDLYDHFRSLCRDVFLYDIGPPQKPGNGAVAIRGFIYSRFVAEWLMENGVLPGDKSARELHLPTWVMNCDDKETLIAALQPWCDGEGSVASTPIGTPVGFSIAQSRHTDLDLIQVSSKLIHAADQGIGNRQMAQITVFGVQVHEYVSAVCRSEILADLRTLFNRLGMNPTMKINRLRLKEDGFWSCVWSLRFGSKDTMEIRKHELVIQEKKRRALETRRHAL
ncbi:MAG: hypothetical protein MUO81_05915 [Thermoplasmata archaeon]|nr:hypothetical protein [Thermoplasmata archaeon]